MDRLHAHEVQRARWGAVLQPGGIQGRHHVLPALRALERPHQFAEVELARRDVCRVVVAQHHPHHNLPSSSSRRRQSVTPPAR